MDHGDRTNVDRTDIHRQSVCRPSLDAGLQFAVQMCASAARDTTPVGSTGPSPMARSCFRFIVATRAEPWSGHHQRSELLEPAARPNAPVSLAVRMGLRGERAACVHSVGPTPVVGPTVPRLRQAQFVRCGTCLGGCPDLVRVAADHANSTLKASASLRATSVE